MKHYGKLIHPQTIITTEQVQSISPGVIKKKGRDFCIQCESDLPSHFHSYISDITNDKIIYCRNCIQLGRMDNVTHYRRIQSVNVSSKACYDLAFELSEQQQYASNIIVEAVKIRQTVLLYAVTGAGKTEMMFKGIQQARQNGDNVAIVSPRVDVVIEISQRIKEAFKDEEIDILHQQSQQQFNGHFIIATVHQLYRFKGHFDVVFIDEVDAFPLSMDASLQQTIKSATKTTCTIIYMTATPPKQLLRNIPTNNIVKLPARFHRQPLLLPSFKYFKLTPNKRQTLLLNMIMQQIRSQRFTLVFFNNIDTMITTYQTYQQILNNLTYVYSSDAFRFEKVERLRKGDYQVLFTTTILERGFTMSKLDVIVIDSHTFNEAALIQIAGRVGRKLQSTSGHVWFLHQGVTLEMLRAKRNIAMMNKLARQKGWLDE
ncbi:DEAD/DEAH box helicase family protein [Staphylococcus simiae]|uniref:DEAD/DEAH box helicase family protein n=2 Tax=Staphylococcus simiae TaxID=308354 RepID=UPI001A969A27|nr:DEAD/DEAH box helicase family protein [Staphylococcus simiae]MBO1198765.1 DEAD/DEAH box helicase family protein [Staphylococcus simiae]MBO1200712.1 DEAD/DEAH box helicase family protein [Staphylococcus simiae]MBO1203225.1 DEAD/DEAH box helicase family protein [Staphylococcus simiae]MBO1210604.1 DEAD/DEAH box helicase family protein [Staphylococcus simiae]MBO1229048.1 DEAD/DEAH box helicase family protein [Staphylococcus simiae]